MKNKKYWYQTDGYICVYNVPKPKNGDFRYIINYDACPEHFM